MAKEIKEEMASNLDDFVKSVEQETIKKVSQSAQGKLVVHVSNLVKEIKTLLENQDDGFEKVIDYLGKQEGTKLDLVKQTEEGYKSIVNSIKLLAKQSQDVVVKNQTKPLTQKEVEKSFVNALEKVENILVKQNEIPEAVSVGYNAQNKVNRIVESYNGYKITTIIQYTDGKVSSWRTTRS